MAEKSAEITSEAPKEIVKEALSRERIEATQRYVFKKVSNVVFGVLGPKMIKKMAAAKVVTPELYDKEGYPVDGGLMDVRLGVIDPGLRCKTRPTRAVLRLPRFEIRFPGAHRSW